MGRPVAPLLQLEPLESSSLYNHDLSITMKPNSIYSAITVASVAGVAGAAATSVAPTSVASTNDSPSSASLHTTPPESSTTPTDGLQTYPPQITPAAQPVGGKHDTCHASDKPDPKKQMCWVETQEFFYGKQDVRFERDGPNVSQQLAPLTAVTLTGKTTTPPRSSVHIGTRVPPLSPSSQIEQ
jgi:hypothetical protein